MAFLDREGLQKVWAHMNSQIYKKAEKNKDELTQYLIDELAKRNQLAPEFANSVEECTDQSKLYVLPDGYIYAYVRHEETVEGGKTPNFTNMLTHTDTDIYTNQRYSMSGGGFVEQSNCSSVVMPIPTGEIIVRFKGVDYFGNESSNRTYVYLGNSATSFTYEAVSGYTNWLVDDNGDTYVTFTNSGGYTYLTTCLDPIDMSADVITINEEITYTTVEGGTIITYEWTNTGHAFVPADYEDRIVALEDGSDALNESVSNLEADVEVLKERPVSSMINTMVYAPSPQLPADGSETADFDADNIGADDIYVYIDALVDKYPQYLTKETLGKDESGNYDWNRYTASRRTYDAWVKPAYPTMYAWVSNATSESDPVDEFTNMLTYSGTVINTNKRYSKSSNTFNDLTGCDSVVIPIPSNGSITVRCRNCHYYDNGAGITYTDVNLGKTTTSFQDGTIISGTDKWLTDDNDDMYFTFTNTTSSTYININLNAVNTTSAIITINEEIVETPAAGNTYGDTIYSVSVSPRVGDMMYTTPYIGTEYGAVAAVNTPNQTRTINGVVFSRDKNKDIAPTLVYTLADYNPYRLGIYATWHNKVYNASRTSIGTIASITDGVLTDSNNNIYNRYPMGDADSNLKRLPVLVIGSNEHGGNGNGDDAEAAIVTARLIKDLCECKNSNNVMLNMLKTEYMIIFCPVINPWGFGKDNGYVNANGVNIDRNFDTPGWGNDTDTRHGAYGGSENETQYFMNTLYASGAKIAMANHVLGSRTDANTGEALSAGMSGYMFGRNNAKYSSHLASIAETMNVNYGLSFYDLNQAPGDTYGKTRSYMDHIGIEGGAVEMTAIEGYLLHGGARHTAQALEADYTLLLQFLNMLIECKDL